MCVREREREREEGVMKPNNIKSENQIEINKWIRKILKTKKTDTDETGQIKERERKKIK